MYASVCSDFLTHLHTAQLPNFLTYYSKQIRKTNSVYTYRPNLRSAWQLAATICVEGLWGGSSRGLGELGSLSAWGRLKQCARYCAALRLPAPDNCPPSFGSLHWGVVGGLLKGTSFFLHIDRRSSIPPHPR
jgi:hypothetical protein